MRLTKEVLFDHEKLTHTRPIHLIELFLKSCEEVEGDTAELLQTEGSDGNVTEENEDDEFTRMANRFAE